MISKNTKIYLVIMAVVLVAAGIGGWLYYKNTKTQGSEEIPEAFLTKEQQKENERILKDPLKETETYRNADPVFSFQYPKGLNVGSFEEGEAGYTVLVQKPNTKIGIQFYTTPFDEDVTLTVDRIKKDLPDTKIDSSEIWNVGGVQAVSFVSENPSFGKTREVWFVYNKNLYQITTYYELSDVLKQILTTWKFN